MENSNVILRLENITKTYPGVLALNNVSLDLIAGEIHALVGENGAGKSTLIKTCTGAVVPDKGSISVNGESFSSMTPKLSEQCGIGVIYQEFNLVSELSAAENIFLGSEIRNGPFVDKKAMAEKAEQVFKDLHININPNTLVKNLTVGYQQMVEIAKAIARNSRILIMDEPSAVLTHAEVASLYEMVEKLKARGVTIVYISHRMDEIFRLSDRITVMRDGNKIETMATSDTGINQLIKLMVGRELKETFPPRVSAVCDETILEVENLCGNGLKDISFKLKKGEILGFGGLIGSGRTELMELIFGVQRPKSGAVVFRGQKITPRNPGEAVKEGIALVPEDRKRQGAHMEMRIDENISIAILKSISRRTLVDKKRERGISEQYQKSLRIKTPSLKQKIKNLSGGNQQKVILAKWLATAPELIIFDEPTRGIDVGAKYEIYKLMNELVENKKTIIMISSEMEELIGMSDRIIVLAGGKITGELEKSAFSQEAIMNCASGVGRHARESLTNANNPTSGMDKNGVTAFINSLLKAKNDIHFGVVQNMKFSRDTFNEKREDIIYPLMDSYFGRGGTQAMVNVVGKEDLENARLHPEKYSNLIVRVGGFSARYVELADDVQIDILNRTLN